MSGLGWGFIGAGVILAFLVWFGVLDDKNNLHTSGAWIMIIFGIVILLFEAAFGRRKK